MRCGMISKARQHLIAGTERLISFDDLRHCRNGNEETRPDQREIRERREVWAASYQPHYCLMDIHERGRTMASMWKRSPGSDGERVVGAKKDACVNPDCSISPISDGASRVTPVRRSLLSSMRSSVT